MKIVINNDQSYEVTRYATEDEWDADDTHTDNRIRSFSLTDTYSDLSIGFIPEEDKTYYLLYAIYTTGDSFHTSSGNIEFVDLFEDEELGWENYRILQNHKEGNGYSAILKNQLGLKYSYHIPWIGYFENLESLELMPIELE